MVVTISGLPGSGTSTLARAVAEALGLPHVDGGQIFRGLAAERDMDVHAFGVLAERDPAIDQELDGRLAARGREGDVVLESRLAGWIATHEDLEATRVWVACDALERARRVSGREGSDVARAAAENARREASEAERYRTYYGIDIGDLGPYDLVVDSTEASAEVLVAQVLAAVGAGTS